MQMKKRHLLLSLNLHTLSDEDTRSDLFVDQCDFVLFEVGCILIGKSQPDVILINIWIIRHQYERAMFIFKLLLTFRRGRKRVCASGIFLPVLNLICP